MICLHCHSPVNRDGFYCGNQCIGERDTRDEWFKEFASYLDNIPTIYIDQVCAYFELSFAIPGDNITPKNAATQWLALTINQEQQL